MTDLSLVQKYLVAMVVELLRIQMDLQTLQEEQEKEQKDKKEEEKNDEKKKKAFFIDRKITAIETWMKQSEKKQIEKKEIKKTQSKQEQKEKEEQNNKYESKKQSVGKTKDTKHVDDFNCTGPLESLLLQDLTSVYNIAFLTQRLAFAIAFVGKKICAHNSDGLLDGLLKTHQYLANQALHSKKSVELARMLSAMT